jgi:hypothetical protein
MRRWRQGPRPRGCMSTTAHRGPPVGPRRGSDPNRRNRSPSEEDEQVSGGGGQAQARGRRRGMEGRTRTGEQATSDVKERVTSNDNRRLFLDALINATVADENTVVPLSVYCLPLTSPAK